MAIATGTAMLASAALGTAASIHSGNRASRAATQGAQAGADAQLQAAREANALQQRMFDTTWAAGAPWRNAGEQALGSIQSFLGMTPQSQSPASSSGSGSPMPVSGAPGGAMQGAIPGMGGSSGYGGSSGAGVPYAGHASGPFAIGQHFGSGGLINTGVIRAGQPDTPSSGMTLPNQLRHIGQQFGIGSGPHLPTYDPNSDVPMQEQMQGAPVRIPQQYSAGGNRESAMGSSRSRAGIVLGHMTPNMVPNGDFEHPHTPGMEEAAAAWRARQELVPRFLGGPIQPGQHYSMAEAEPEVLTTPQGSQLITEPTIMQATQPGYVTPGPMGQAAGQQFGSAPQDPSSSGHSGFDQFLNSTNYQFTRDQGSNALNRLLARTGHLGSGRGQMAAIDYNQNMAHSNAIGPYMNQLNLLAGLGQNSAMQGGNQAMQAGGIMGNNIMQGGMAAGNALAQGGANRASAYQNTGNAINNMFNQYAMWRGYSPGLKGGGP